MTEPTLHDKLITAMQNEFPIQSPAELTEREEEIFRLVATGTSNKDIARQLFISSNTVKVHLRNIFGKIGVASRTEAAVFAIHAGLTKSADLSVLEPAPQELPSTSQGSLFSKMKPPLLLVSILMMVTLMGVVSFLVIRNRTTKIAVANPVPVALQRWQELAALPTARSGLAVAVYEDQIYAIGGKTAQGVTGVMEQYNVATNLWTTLPSKPLPVTDVNAAVIGGQIYVPGGRLASGDVTDTLESYNPDLKLWEKHAPMPDALSGYALVAYEGKLLLFGGWDGQKSIASVFEYDPGQDKWTERSSMPTARAFAGAAIAAGKIYVVGGYNGKTAQAVNEEYLPDRDSWSRSEPLPAGRYSMGVTSIADFIYVVGGIGETNSKPLPLQYSFQQHQWQTFEGPPPQLWSSLGLAPVQTRLYAMGGIWNGSPATYNLSYQAIYSAFVPVSP